MSDVEIRLQNIDRQEPELPSGANDTSALKEAAVEEEHVSEKKDVGEAETDTEKSTSVVQEAANPDVTAE